MVCTSQQINNFHIILKGIFCLGSEMALIVLEECESGKNEDYSLSEQPICFSNDA